MDQNNEYLQKRISKLDKKLEEIRNYSGSSVDGYMDNPMTVEEKKTLALNIRGLQSEHLPGIRDIVCETSGESKDTDELEFDLAKLSVYTLRRLERYVKSKLMMMKMNKKITAKKEMKLKAQHDTANNKVGICYPR